MTIDNDRRPYLGDVPAPPEPNRPQPAPPEGSARRPDLATAPGPAATGDRLGTQEPPAAPPRRGRADGLRRRVGARPLAAVLAVAVLAGGAGFGVGLAVAEPGPVTAVTGELGQRVPPDGFGGGGFPGGGTVPGGPGGGLEELAPSDGSGTGTTGGSTESTTASTTGSDLGTV